MQRPGRVDVDLAFERGELMTVRIGGDAVIVSRGRLSV
jgi:predicted PhzF superfamily epimerase YddE/YHI9